MRETRPRWTQAGLPVSGSVLMPVSFCPNHRHRFNPRQDRVFLGHYRAFDLRVSDA